MSAPKREFPLKRAYDLEKGDIIELNDYPCDLLEVKEVEKMVKLRWGFGDDDMMWVTRATPFEVIGHLNV